MSDRLPTHLLIGALLRRVNDSGGLATVLAKGDADTGAILVIAMERQHKIRAFERAPGHDVPAKLVIAGPQEPANEAEMTAYWQRRRSRDPDLWVIELDIAEAERFAAETICSG